MRKQAALSRFLGVCLERVSMEQMLIETVFSVDTEVKNLGASNNDAEEHSKLKDDEFRLLMNVMKTKLKNPIDNEFERYAQMGAITDKN